MDRDHLEALIWQHWPTRGTLADRSVTAILDAADAYAAATVRRNWRRRKPYRRPRRPVLHHTSSTDLWPLIGALAEALLSNETERAA